MVFHHPLPVEDQPKVGSTTHVMRMIDGFRDAGFEVELVAGHSRERLQAMKRVRHDIIDGRVFQFVYAEASTAPTCLNDRRHLPLHPVGDWRFFRYLRHHGLPVGLFYPDIHWRFPFYRAVVPSVKRHLAVAFYRFDLWWYKDVLDLLFLPSARMQLAVPGWEHSDRVVGLAPGGVSQPFDLTQRQGELHLFYVGSIAPPLYDIGMLIAAVAEVPGVFLTVCCPPGEAHLASSVTVERVRVVHEHGDALRERYRACDVACLVYPPEPYREFAMPVKLFEAIGFGRPVLTSSGTSAADFVERTGTGWVVDEQTLVSTLRQLVAEADRVRVAHDAVISQQSAHSWESRARFVAAALSAPLGARPTSATEPASR
jgi:glycosyltransferase involved in cell wall biosynthesis